MTGLLLGGSSSVAAQQWGLVWRPPEDSLQVLQAWQRLQQTGVQALRLESTDVPTFLLEAADTSGLALFVELPMVEVPARQLRRRLPEMQAVLRTLLQQVAAHPSVRAIGLARLVDTADPSACVYFEVLRADVQRVRPELQVYYETRFIEADRCGQTVDFVLVDARDVSDPLRLLQRWQQAHPTVPVGIGRLGTWVRSDTLRGRRVPHAPEWQARYLEQHLRRLQGTFTGPVFVYRWRDVRRTSPALHLDRPFVESYGLHDLQGQARPAFEVVRGFFTGTQTIFAFPAGIPPARPWPWAVLMGWGPIVLLVLSYRFSPLFRLLGMRYFRAHGFYTEAVQHGRDLPVGALWGLGVAGGGALGVTLAVVVQMLRESAAVAWGVQLLSPEVGKLIVVAVRTPVGLSLFVLLGSIGLLGLWALGLALLSRWGYRIGFMQAWTLAHMPRWPLFALMIAALSLRPAAEVGHSLLALWLFVEGWGMVRTLRDVAQVVKGAGWMSLLITLLHPGWWLLLVVLGSLGWGLYTGHTIFFWHLLTIP
ncbi:hypothetical protein [Rhodothermus profundi]|uniref:Uncharacterized protein n=1 Tax=Rhodothermus profundi TaxID=633813 RepID=A0A1M6RG29_9BACT|nr:hypothetical protein [Rhodothermus profundi]SHK31424.1 hypothetical protein SAMN04488087_0834 [Rhodothermus profundi]